MTTTTDRDQQLSATIRTELLSISDIHAAIRLRIGRESHRLELAAREGRFIGLVDRVEVALEAWFPKASTDAGRVEKWLRNAVVKLVRERHEGQLPRPADPRRLPLTLPGYGPKTNFNGRFKARTARA